MSMRVAAANEDMARAWDGDEGSHWATYADHYDAAMAGYAAAFDAAMSVRPDDRVLDIGCGNGVTTLAAAAQSHDGSALGVDLSTAMIEVARRRAAQASLTNVAFEQGDAQVHPFPEAAFDLAISRNGAMFFGDQLEAFTNIARAVAPGGRLALLAWRSVADNEWLREIGGALTGAAPPSPPPGAPSPVALSDADHVRRLLTDAGFAEVQLQPEDRPMRFGESAEEAYDFLRSTGAARGMLEQLDERAAAAALGRLRAMLEAHATPDGVLLGSGAWVITARRS